MMRKMLALGMLAGAGALVWPQETSGDRVSVPFSDPSRPGTVKVSLINGGITVRGYDGKEVIVEARSQGERPVRQPRPNPKTAGLHRLTNPSSGLNVEEQDNVVRVSTAPGQGVAITVQVPYATSLNLHTMNNGDIVVEDVRGEIDANDLNGAITLKDVSGAVVAHSLNRGVTATFDRVPPGKAMSFSSMNGDIDVTLPADAKARVKMKSEAGEIYSDFDIKLEAQSPAQPERKNGRYRLQFDRALTGTINGGGPEMQFTTFNGQIYIRRKK